MWEIQIKKKAEKHYRNLPERVKKAFRALANDIRQRGPVRGDWPNYGPLGKKRHHCHILKGKPTYVAVWEVIGNKTIKLVEVHYVGTHEKAPY